ncbi:DUF4865 family protein [Sphaerisporangium perillae]|uniref:DUF4865 family protein n=1 Tax=Sphaerisporangium perillae TaxID=2935860 RepID=UPI003556D56C
MGVIWHRGATGGAALDAFSGLGLKACVIRERGVDGSPVDQYAPFLFVELRHRDEQVPSAAALAVTVVRTGCRCARCRAGRRSRG